MTINKKYSSSQPYLMIGAGICLVIIRFFDNNNTWESIGIIKIIVGATMIGYGLFKLIKNKN